jgi:hypothetical protein
MYIGFAKFQIHFTWNIICGYFLNPIQGAYLQGEFIFFFLPLGSQANQSYVILNIQLGVF